ncbi:hypothetical protein Ga0100231_016585 [Opitutaceae bacterium TAV4]|nr:hypothetical protein Ga0100231_016585 [Opitutaceae bacterium TAV4]RRK02167.1 hypothetical protein Ga0100230_002910 [Opitutaceae bacterium TAV3]
MITRIQATRYRCFESLDVELCAVTVLVGRNGAGKSTLLDIPVLIGEMLLATRANDAFFRPTASHPRRPRADSALDLIFNRQGNYFSLAVELLLPDHIAQQVSARHVRYELAFAVDGTALSLSQETVLLFDERPSADSLPAQGFWGPSRAGGSSNVREVLSRDPNGQTTFWREAQLRGPKPKPTTINTQASAMALNFVPSDLDAYPVCNWLKSFLLQECALYQPDLAALRTAQPYPGADFKVASNASSLAWSVLELQKNSARHADWIMHVQSALPHVAGIEARQREDDQMAYVRLRYDNDLVVPAHGLSDGTLSVLAHTILPFLPNVPRFLAVEEPENGIHPKAIETVLESLAALAPGQAIVSTHSPIAVAATKLDQILCLRREEAGRVKVIPGPQVPQLADWQGQPNLGRLFAMGVL